MTDLKYIEKRYRLRKVLSRYRLGVQKFVIYPILNILWIVLFITMNKIYGLIEIFITDPQIPLLLQTILQRGYQVLQYILPIVIVFSVLYIVGVMISQKDEANICVVFGESSRHIRTPSILYSKKKIKGSECIERKFYTYMGMNRWKEKRTEIEDLLNCCIINEFRYADNHGNKIAFQSMHGREGKKRGVIYDEF